MEYVWWPAFGHFEHLHPEYEVIDFRDGTRFLDFAYVREPHRLAMEIDGYGPHLQKMSRSQFSDQWMRQNHLVLSGWKILRFSLDDVKDRPRMCEQLLRGLMEKGLLARVGKGSQRIYCYRLVKEAIPHGLGL